MIHTRHFTSSLAIRDNGDGRTLVGPLLPWGVRARVADRGRLVTETFERGALAGTDPSRVPLTATHPRDNQTLPIGVTVELEERADAAWAPGGSATPCLATRSWPWPATGCRSGCRSVSWKSLGVAAGLLTAAAWFERGPHSTTWPWSECPPTKVPGWSACEGPHQRAPPRHSSH
jgi:hypothetical protein